MSVQHVPTPATAGAVTSAHRVKDQPSRLPELGRIRLGDSVAAGKGKRPRRSDTFILTSADRTWLEAAAEVYGGTVEAWEDGPEPWRVYTDATELSVLVPENPVSTDYEVWSGRGCMRRCDGQTANVVHVHQGTGEGSIDPEPCVCAAMGWRAGRPEDVKAGACAFVVRVRLVLPDLPGIGIVMLTTHSWFAGRELPAVADLLSALHASGAFVPARLTLEAKTIKRPTAKVPTTTFLRPMLRVDRTPGEIHEAMQALNGDDMAHPQHLAAHTAIAVRACRAFGVDDDESKAIVRALTDGQSDSRKDLSIAQAQHMANVIADGSWRELVGQPALPAGEPEISGEGPDGEVRPSPEPVKPRENPYARAVHVRAHEVGMPDEDLRWVLTETVGSETANTVNRSNRQVVLDAIDRWAAAHDPDGVADGAAACSEPGCTDPPEPGDTWCSSHLPF